MLKAKTSTACEITRMDPKRLNEIGSIGIYPCLPETRPGASRIFDRNDLITLRCHVIMRGAGIPESLCGKVACTVRDFLGIDGMDVFEKVEWVRIHFVPEEFQEIRQREFFVSMNSYDAVRSNQLDGIMMGEDVGMPVSLFFNIKVLRDEITYQLEARKNIV
jgi:hypothetical protein